MPEYDREYWIFSGTRGILDRGDGMTVQSIREAFPECGVLASSMGISLILPAYEPPRSVSFSADEAEFHNMEALLWLCRCDSLSLIMAPGHSIRLVFAMETPFKDEVGFRPIKEPVSPEESRAAAIRAAQNNPDFMGIFRDINPYDDKQVMGGFLELAEKKSRLTDLSGYRRWSVFRAESAEFLNRQIHCQYSIEPPTPDLDFGTIEFYLDAEKPRVIEIGPDAMPALRKMLAASTGLGISGIVSSGAASMTLSVFS